jgi:xanthine dehydrogenase YagR molybdenum-binding subunit
MSNWPTDTKYISRSTTRVDASRQADRQRALFLGHPGGRLALRHDPALQMAGRKNSVREPGQGTANARHQGRRRRGATASFNVRFYGEEIAAVAGTTKQAVWMRCAPLKSRPSQHEFVVNEDEARKEMRPRSGRARPMPPTRTSTRTGNVDTAFPECAAVIEGFYTTPVQIHNPMETHGNTVSWTDEGVTAGPPPRAFPACATAWPARCSWTKARCASSPITWAAVSAPNSAPAWKACWPRNFRVKPRRPVRLMLTRFDKALAVGNRPSSFQKIKMGALADGTLHAFEAENYGTAGIGAAATPAAAAAARTFPCLIFTRCPIRA